MVSQRISAKDCEFYIGDVRVGGAEEMAVTLTADNEEAFEAANYMCVEIVAGKRHVAGNIMRAYVDNTIIQDLIPNNAQELPTPMTITGQVVTGKTPSRKIVVFGALFDSVSLEGLGLDAYAKNNLQFKGTSWEWSD